MNAPKPERGGVSQIGKNAFSTVASAGFGTVSSIILDAIVVARFGMGNQTDAYFIATTIPIVIMTVLVLQATRVVQPIFLAKRESESSEAGWEYLRLILTNGTILVTGVCLAGMALSPLLMRLQTAGSVAEAPIASQLSIFLFAFLWLYVPIAVMRAALNSLGEFAIPGATKFFENVFKIAFVLMLGGAIGVQALILGALFGALAQAALFYWMLRRRGFTFRFRFGLAHADMKRTYGLVSYQLTGQISGIGVEVFNNAMGSHLGVGNVTALRLATRIIDSFAGLLPGSVVEAAMPAVARSAAQRDTAGMKRHLHHTLYLLQLVTLPLSVWLALVNRQLIALLYQRASFSSTDTQLVSTLLFLMIPYLFLGRLRSLFELPFFATHNTRSPVFASFVEAVTYVLSTVLLASRLGVYALPTGRTIAALIGPCVLGWLLRRRIGSLQFGSVWSGAAKVCAASLVMAACIFLGLSLVDHVPASIGGAKLIALAVPSAIGFGSVVVLFSMMGVINLSMLRQLDFLRARRASE
ncbi:MAG TPA: lipid II flippase MurJ [Terriglobia bacterium]|nr:lipid II flippase MurJ [Terriglobia bacterium]